MDFIQNNSSGDADVYRQSYDIFSRLAEDRNLFINGEINDNVANMLIAQMLFLNAKDPKTPISLYINSPGGSVMPALAIVDVIHSIQAPVYTFCISLCASAAALVLSSGKKGQRYIYPHSRVMIHTVRGVMDGPISDISISYNLMNELNREVYEALSANTGQSIDVIQKDSERDYWLNSFDAIAYGLVDKVISRRTNI